MIIFLFLWTIFYFLKSNNLFHPFQEIYLFLKKLKALRTTISFSITFSVIVLSKEDDDDIRKGMKPVFVEFLQEIYLRRNLGQTLPSRVGFSMHKQYLIFLNQSPVVVPILFSFNIA